MLKKDIRSHHLRLRNSLSFSTLANSSLTIASKLLQLPIWSLNYYHIFLSITEKKEIDTSFIVSLLQGKNKNIVLPKMTDDFSLSHYLLTDSTSLRKNKWNILEPVDGIEVPVEKLDVVFVPLLAFDKRGHRVGYGKGYYDRFLSQGRTDVLKIGLSLFEAIEVIDDIDDTDVALDFCVTPLNNYIFSEG